MITLLNIGAGSVPLSEPATFAEVARILDVAPNTLTVRDFDLEANPPYIEAGDANALNIDNESADIVVSVSPFGFWVLNA